jgi:hypothetical protein
VTNLVSKLSIVTMTMSLAGCASLHPGKYAQPLSSGERSSFAAKVATAKKPTPSGLLVSGEENVALSSEYFTALDLSFENTTSEWLRIKKADLDFGDDVLNKEIVFPAGNDLAEWAESAQRRKAIRDQNAQMILSAVMAAGATVALTSSDPRTQGAGAAVSLAGAGALTVNSIKNRNNAIQYASLVPKSHLLSSDFVVPPGMTVKKWIAVYTKNPTAIPYASKAMIKLTYDSGKEEFLMLPFRKGIESSEWQRRHAVVTETVKKKYGG